MGNQPPIYKCMYKFNKLHKKSRQSLWQQICRKTFLTSTQSDPDQNQGWLVNEAIIVFGLIYMMNTARTDNKTPKGRIKCDSHHETEIILLVVLLRFGAF